MTRLDGRTLIVAAILPLVAMSLAIASPIHAQTSHRQPPLMDRGPDEGSWIDGEEEEGPGVTEERTDAHAWYLLGRSFHNVGDYRAAITSWKRAEALGFALPFTRYNIAAAHARLGEVEPAFDWLNAALDAGFAEVDLLIVDDDLSQLRSDARFARAVLRAYENGEPCTDAESRKKLEQWTAGPRAMERSGFQFATLGPWLAACGRETSGRPSAPTRSPFGGSATAPE